MSETLEEVDEIAKTIPEVAPPGWGHTVAKKEKTKPNKPKSKIGGSAHEFQKDLDSGKFKGLPGDKTKADKKASMFKLMWSMKNKGDKPHYKPGVKDKLKSQYKEEVEMDEKNWIQGAIKKPGALHRDLDVPQGEKIPAGKLKAAAKEGGKIGQRARLAQTLKKMHNEYFPEDDKGKPEQGKLYALTGRSDQPSIARGDSWKKSVVTKKRKEQDAKKND